MAHVKYWSDQNPLKYVLSNIYPEDIHWTCEDKKQASHKYKLLGIISWILIAVLSAVIGLLLLAIGIAFAILSLATLPFFIGWKVFGKLAAEKG